MNIYQLELELIISRIITDWLAYVKGRNDTGWFIGHQLHLHAEVTKEEHILWVHPARCTNTPIKPRKLQRSTYEAQKSLRPDSPTKWSPQSRNYDTTPNIDNIHDSYSTTSLIHWYIPFPKCKRVLDENSLVVYISSTFRHKLSR